MDAMTRVEDALAGAIAHAEHTSSPPRLTEAVHYAVFPGGARIRPRLCLAVAAACGDDSPILTDAAAASIELLHCASLVHDDLPCFDDASMRRGKTSLHRAYGEPLAVLTGDALIVLAFEFLASRAAAAPERLAELIGIVGRSVGTRGGIVAGQAWELEPCIDLALYQRAKTGSLFSAATIAGAAAAGAESAPWRVLGERLGEAYQVADDIQDVVANPEELGKPVGRDEALDRPSAVRDLGVDGSVQRLKQLVAEGIESIPKCDGAAELKDLIVVETKRFLPSGLARRAA